MGDAGDPREGAEEDVRLDGGETKKTRRHGGWRASAKMISIYGRVHEVLGAGQGWSSLQEEPLDLLHAPYGLPADRALLLHPHCRRQTHVAEHVPLERIKAVGSGRGPGGRAE